MRIVRFLSILLLTLSLSAVAVADEGGSVVDEDLGVTVMTPDDWEINTEDSNAVASFQHPDTKSQIELIATELMNEEVADVFFETFHTTLEESGFVAVSEEEETIGGLEGALWTYEFEHSDVTLQIQVFEFLRNDVAWLVVGYADAEESDAQDETYRALIEGLEFDED